MRLFNARWNLMTRPTVFGGNPSSRAKSRSRWRRETSAASASSADPAWPPLARSASRASTKVRFGPTRASRSRKNASRSAAAASGSRSSRSSTSRCSAPAPNSTSGRRRRSARRGEGCRRERPDAPEVEPHAAHPDPTVLLDANGDQPLRIEVRCRDLRCGTADHLTPVGRAEVEDEVGACVDEHLDPEVHALSCDIEDEPVVLDEVAQLRRRPAEDVHRPRT